MHYGFHVVWNTTPVCLFAVHILPSHAPDAFRATDRLTNVAHALPTWIARRTNHPHNCATANSTHDLLFSFSILRVSVPLCTPVNLAAARMHTLCGAVFQRDSGNDWPVDSKHYHRRCLLFHSLASIPGYSECFGSIPTLLPPPSSFRYPIVSAIYQTIVNWIKKYLVYTIKII